MVTLQEKGKSYLIDLKKRAAREYSLGYFSRKEFDDFLEKLREVNKMLKLSKKRHENEGENEDENKTDDFETRTKQEED